MAAENGVFPIFLSLSFALFIILIAAAYFFLNYPLEVRAESIQTESMEKVGPIVNGKQIYSYEQMEKDISILSKSYPSIIQSQIIGSSVAGKNIYAVKLGKGEKEIFLSGTHHAYEHMTTNVLMKMIDLYAGAYVDDEKIADYSVKTVLDKISIWFVPMVNPDGVDLVQKGNCGICNQEFVAEINQYNTDFTSWKANIRGVDLNRQYPVLWKSIINNPGKPAPADYKGIAPLTEPEALALYNFTNSRNFEASISYHSSGNTIFTRLGNDRHTAKLASLVSKATGYQIIDLTSNLSGGGFSDWFILIKKRPALTMEISPFLGPRPVPLKNWDEIWKRNKAVGIIAAGEVLSWFPQP
jgi:g-D-glutamyl-meso-diaminopimelate peptidase